jgi:RES domain-containing protein
MIVYRLAQSKYSDDLKGMGAFLYGGRWNYPEHYILYTAEHISLAVLEILVSIKISSFDATYSLLSIEIPDEGYKTLEPKKLKKDWDVDTDYTRSIGKDFLKNNELLYMKVPSAVIPQEHNIIINPLHSAIKKIKVIKKAAFKFDKRLLHS